MSADGGRAASRSISGHNLAKVSHDDSILRCLQDTAIGLPVPVWGGEGFLQEPREKEGSGGSIHADAPVSEQAADMEVLSPGTDVVPDSCGEDKSSPSLPAEDKVCIVTSEQGFPQAPLDKQESSRLIQVKPQDLGVTSTEAQAAAPIDNSNGGTGPGLGSSDAGICCPVLTKPPRGRASGGKASAGSSIAAASMETNTALCGGDAAKRPRGSSTGGKINASDGTAAVRTSSAGPGAGKGESQHLPSGSTKAEELFQQADGSLVLSEEESSRKRPSGSKRSLPGSGNAPIKVASGISAAEELKEPGVLQRASAGGAHDDDDFEPGTQPNPRPVPASASQKASKAVASKHSSHARPPREKGSGTQKAVDQDNDLRMESKAGSRDSGGRARTSSGSAGQAAREVLVVAEDPHSGRSNARIAVPEAGVDRVASQARGSSSRGRASAGAAVAMMTKAATEVRNAPAQGVEIPDKAAPLLERAASLDRGHDKGAMEEILERAALNAKEEKKAQEDQLPHPSSSGPLPAPKSLLIVDQSLPQSKDSLEETALQVPNAEVLVILDSDSDADEAQKEGNRPASSDPDEDYTKPLEEPDDENDKDFEEPEKKRANHGPSASSKGTKEKGQAAKRSGGASSGKTSKGQQVAGKRASGRGRCVSGSAPEAVDMGGVGPGPSGRKTVTLPCSSARGRGSGGGSGACRSEVPAADKVEVEAGTVTAAAAAVCKAASRNKGGSGRSRGNASGVAASSVANPADISASAGKAHLPEENQTREPGLKPAEEEGTEPCVAAPARGSEGRKLTGAAKKLSGSAAPSKSNILSDNSGSFVTATRVPLGSLHAIGNGLPLESRSDTEILDQVVVVTSKNLPENPAEQAVQSPPVAGLLSMKKPTSQGSYRVPGLRKPGGRNYKPLHPGALFRGK